jgi:hypothetical protein
LAFRFASLPSPPKPRYGSCTHVGGNFLMTSKSPYLSKWKVFYFVTALTGIILLYFEIHIYRLTIIPIAIPISISLLVGIVTFLFNKNHYKNTFNTRGPFFPLVQNIGSWGFISCYLFMATNYYFADPELKDLQFEIKSKSSMPGPKRRRHETKPTVTIDYFGFNKELVFKFKDTERVENADKLKLTVKKGLIGFDIVNHYDTVDENKW